MRKEYELTDEQYHSIIDASKPVPYLIIGGVPPRSQQDNANSAWQALGEELGFDWKTAQPIPSKGPRFFTAVATKAEDVPDRWVNAFLGETIRKGY